MSDVAQLIISTSTLLAIIGYGVAGIRWALRVEGRLARVEALVNGIQRKPTGGE